MADAARIEEEALFAMSTGDWLEAADLFARLEDMAPSVATWSLRRGECLRHAGRWRDAIAALSRGVNTYVQGGESAKALPVCEQILQLEPGNAPIRALLERLQAVLGADGGTLPVLPQAWNSSAAMRALVRQSGRFPRSALTLLAEDPFATGSGGQSGLKLELPPDLPAVAAAPKPPARPRVVLPVTPFFSALNPQQLRMVNLRARLLHLSPGEVVYAAAEPSDALFVLASGAMAVLMPEEVVRLERGAVFGEEVVLLPGHTRMATVRAAEPSQLLVLDAELVQALVAKVPHLLAILTQQFCERLVLILARTSPMLATLPEADSLALLHRFRYGEVEQGVRLCEPGGASGLFILLAGAAVASFNDTFIERLQPGDVFGEIALVTDAGVGVSVTAREKCFVLHLPEADFACIRPDVERYLEVLAARRLARMEQAVLDEAPVSQAVPLPPSVLVIHGEPDTRQDYQRALSEAGFLVDGAGEAATVAVLIANRRYDVVVYHLDPFGQAGSDMLHDIRTRDLDVPIILTTRNSTFDSTSATANYSVVRGFHEPLDVDDLVRAANRAVHFHRLTRLRREAMTRLTSSGEWMGDRAGLEFHFQTALSRLHMAFQPIVSATDNTLFAFEAFLRSGEELLHSPLSVLRAAERLNRVHEVGRIARDIVAATMAGLPDPPVMFINVHSQDLLDHHLLDPRSPITAFAQRIVLEITERTPLDELSDLGARVQDLRAVGYRFALDNLGAGHAGVASLAQLEPEVCKLDISLIRGIDQDSVRWDLVRGILAVCRDMNILTVCEGVETLAERDALLQLRADLMQGYLFAKPGPAFPTVDFAALRLPDRG